MPSAPDQHAASRLIRKLESIAVLSVEERRAVASLPMRLQTFDARRDIVRDGDRPSQCCLLVDGWACRYKLLNEGKRQILSFHIPGDIPDLHGLHIGNMDHGLTALKQATVAFVPHGSLQELIALHPGLAAVFWRDTLVNAAVFEAWLTGMGRRSAYQRIAHLFCEMYLRLKAVGLAGDYRCPLPVTQVDLADALGLTSVHVNRVLREMRSNALISLRNRTLVIEAWDELLRASDFDPTYLHLRPLEVEVIAAPRAAAGNRQRPHRQRLGLAEDGLHARSA
jgi:CRP-like cAMP-binding protein